MKTYVIENKDNERFEVDENELEAFLKQKNLRWSRLKNTWDGWERNDPRKWERDYKIVEVLDDSFDFSKMFDRDGILEIPQDPVSVKWDGKMPFVDEISQSKIAKLIDNGKPIKDKDCYKCLLIADLHFDHQDDSVVDIIKQFYKNHTQDIDEICYLGDELDLNSISKFKTIVKNKENPIKQLNMFVDFSSTFNTHQVRLGSNHIDERLSKYIELHPELEDLFNEFKERLDKNINKTTEYGEYYYPFADLGNDIIRLTHGKYLSAKAYADRSKTDTVLAHIHTVQVHTSPLKTIAYSIPCACKINPKYNLGLETAWNQGFAVLNFYPKLKKYVIEYVIVKDGVGIYRDEVYKATI